MLVELAQWFHLNLQCTSQLKHWYKDVKLSRFLRYISTKKSLVWSLDFGIYFPNLTFNFKTICNYSSWKYILMWISCSELISVGCSEWDYVMLILVVRQVFVTHKVFIFQCFQVLYFHIRIGAVLNIDTWGSRRFASLCCSTDKFTRMFCQQDFCSVVNKWSACFRIILINYVWCVKPMFRLICIYFSTLLSCSNPWSN